MSETTEPKGSGTAVPTKDDEQPEPLSFTLIVVSPSVGAASRLSFPHLPATTTVKQLKAKIRDSLESKPADENQRIIHRGRMLARETETMLDVFGKETVNKSDFVHFCNWLTRTSSCAIQNSRLYT
jgi:hypothetical protein